MTRISLSEGDLVDAEVDAIVNAANTHLVLGSGVAGAIARRGGDAIARECAEHGPIELGAAAATGAGDLPFRFVIHAAGMEPGQAASEESVRSAVRNALALALELGCQRVALPAIGAGVGGLSLQRCAEISLEEARQAAQVEPGLEEIRFVLFGEPAFRLFEMVNDAARVEEQMRKLKGR